MLWGLDCAIARWKSLCSKKKALLYNKVVRKHNNSIKSGGGGGVGYRGSWPGHLPGNCVIWMLIPAIHVLVFVQTAHTIPKCLARPRICLGLPLCLFFPSSCTLHVRWPRHLTFWQYLVLDRKRITFIYLQVKAGIFDSGIFNLVISTIWRVECVRLFPEWIIFKHQSLSVKKSSTTTVANYVLLTLRANQSLE